MSQSGVAYQTYLSMKLNLFISISGQNQDQTFQHTYATNGNPIKQLIQHKDFGMTLVGQLTTTLSPQSLSG